MQQHRGCIACTAGRLRRNLSRRAFLGKSKTVSSVSRKNTTSSPHLPNFVHPLLRICVVLKSNVGLVQQLMTVQNVDLVKPMLDQAFSFALLAMANAARFEYIHHGIRAVHWKPVCLLQLDE